MEYVIWELMEANFEEILIWGNEGRSWAWENATPLKQLRFQFPLSESE